MKKTILSFLCIGSTMMLLAQQAPPATQKTPNMNTNNQPVTTPEVIENRNTIGNTPPDNNYNTGTLNSTMSNAAMPAATIVSVPASVQTSFTTAYPTAGTVTWRQAGDWYRARYKDENGKLMEASYREDGKTFVRAASPIMRTYVPQEAIDKAVEMYGADIYAIAMVKGTEGDMYNVTVIENGESRTMWMNADGSAVMNPYRTETTEQNSDMNTTQPVNNEPVAEPATTTPAENAPVESTEPKQEIMDTMDDTQPVIEEGQTSELDESNRLNREGINNGKGSDDMMPEHEYEHEY